MIADESQETSSLALRHKVLPLGSKSTDQEESNKA